MSALLDAVAAYLGERAQVGAPLGERTTYRVGGPAAVLVEADGVDDLQAVHEALRSTGGEVPVLVVGQGSNLLVADRGFCGLAVVLGRGLSGITLPAAPETVGSAAALHVTAGGGAKLPVLARRSAAAGFHGLEWAVGVPGSVGGAVRMNAGGHGADMASVLVACQVFDLGTGSVTERGVAALALGYRRSALRAGELVLRADLRVVGGERARAEATVADVVRWRRAHQPGGANAGSVFTNPPGDAAGRLVEMAGLKGYRHGSAAVSDKHANFVQADAGGSADDVRAVIEHVRAEVARRSGVELVPELVMVGFERTLDGVVAVR